VQSDTITTAEQKLAREIAPKAGEYQSVLTQFAETFKGKIKSDFTYNRAWGDSVFTRLTAAGVKIDRAQFDEGRRFVDTQLEFRIARVAFGDTAAKRHELKDDTPLRNAVDILKRSNTQKEVFAAAASTPRATGVAKSGGR
jgi:hypothetical protein